MPSKESKTKGPETQAPAEDDFFADLEVKKLTPEQLSNLKSQFDIYKAAKNLLPLNKVRKVLQRAKIDIREEDLSRMIALADIVCDDEDLLTFGQLKNLALNQVDVNMLHSLFQHANQDTKNERVEYFLDVDEIFNICAQLGLKKTKPEIQEAMDALDDKGDADGRIDWEEFLSIASTLLGASVAIAKDDPDGTDFNQLRDSTKRMKQNMGNTRAVVKELRSLIMEKKAEIERRIKDHALEDIRKVLKKEWDDKDKLELDLLDSKKGHFDELSKLMGDNDREKEDIKTRFRDTIAARNRTRDEINQRREMFRGKFNEHFNSFQDINNLLAEIDEASKVVQKGVADVTAEQESMEEVMEQTKKFEMPPKISSSSEPIDFVRNQSMVIDEIKTKMQMMQRERDKYEEMIAKEMDLNKQKRIECVKLNMRITNLESKQLGLEQKFQEQDILASTLQKELDEKTKDTDSKKVKGLKNTVFQFTEEKSVIEDQVEETKSKLRQATVRYAKMHEKVSQLSIELGELKILLEDCKGMEVCFPGEETLTGAERAVRKAERDAIDAREKKDMEERRKQARENAIIAEAKRKKELEETEKRHAKALEEAKKEKKRRDKEKQEKKRKLKEAQDERYQERMKAKKSGKIMRQNTQNLERFAMEMEAVADDMTPEEKQARKKALEKAPIDVRDAAKSAAVAAQVAMDATFASFATLIIVDSAVEVAEIIRKEREAHGSDSDWGDEDSDADPVWMALRASAFERFQGMDKDNSGSLDREEMLSLVAWLTEEMRNVVGRSAMSKRESEKMAGNLMTHVDDNDDGEMDFEEFYNYVEEMRSEGTQRVAAANKIQAIARGKRDRKKVSEIKKRK